MSRGRRSTSSREGSGDSCRGNRRRDKALIVPVNEGVEAREMGAARGAAVKGGPGNAFNASLQDLTRDYLYVRAPHPSLNRGAPGGARLGQDHHRHDPRRHWTTASCSTSYNCIIAGGPPGQGRNPAQILQTVTRLALWDSTVEVERLKQALSRNTTGH